MEHKDWKKSESTILNKPCIQHKNNMNKGFRHLPAEYEQSLVGKHGEIWMSHLAVLPEDNIYGILIHKISVARKALRVLGRVKKRRAGVRPLGPGDELVLYLKTASTLSILGLLKIPKHQGDQIRYANEFRMVGATGK